MRKPTMPPQLGEPLPVELANTTYAVRGRMQDGLHTPEQLALWLTGVRDRLPVPLTDADLRAVGEGDLERARAIRDAVRDIAASAVRGETPAPEAVEQLNRQVAAVPCWRELRWGAAPQADLRMQAPPVVAALAAIAQAAVDLFGGAGLSSLRACPGPGCVLFFVQDHPRRRWCSVGCGNRARAARHYARVRGS
ncbi:CGNR zinc finger domain-containing protein [Streptomyces indicus]|uniref:CGNR zinc finger domain-containing protein n=1 Tax=Streptomyces indicus TaxID=417292 RepID=UPI001C408D43|nr:CGNR zinc finger domain-containing protein [Streptomyces indicus]